MTNRSYKNIDKKLHASLLSSFPTIKEVISDEDVSEYRHVAITVWDHWLSEQEAAEEFGDLSLEKQKMHDKKLHAFVCELTSTYPSYLVKFSGPYKKRSVCLKTFTSAVTKNISVRPLPYLASNAHRFILLIPELELIYMEAWDFTHHVYFRKDASIDILKMTAIKHQIFVI